MLKLSGKGNECKSQPWCRPPQPQSRDLHTFTFPLNVSAFCGTRGAFWGRVRGV